MKQRWSYWIKFGSTCLHTLKPISWCVVVNGREVGIYKESNHWSARQVPPCASFYWIPFPSPPQPVMCYHCRSVFLYHGSGEGNGNPLQYSSLENSMNRGAKQGAVRGVTKSRTWLSDSLTYSLITVGEFAPLGAIWQCLETFLVVTTVQVPLALVGRGQEYC